MIVLSTTATTFKFIPRQQVANVNVVIENDATNTEVYNQSIVLTDDRYYKVVTDMAGFALIDEQYYIITIKENDLIVYRDIIYCTDNTPDTTFIQNTTDDANEFIIYDS